MDTVEVLPDNTFERLPQWLQTAVNEGIALLGKVVHSRTQEESRLPAKDVDEVTAERATYAEVASLFSDLLERFESSPEFAEFDQSACYAELLVLYGRALLGSAWNTLEQEAESNLLGPPVPRLVATEARASDQEAEDNDSIQEEEIDERDAEDTAEESERARPDNEWTERAGRTGTTAAPGPSYPTDAGSVGHSDNFSPGEFSVTRPTDEDPGRAERLRGPADTPPAGDADNQKAAAAACETEPRGDENAESEHEQDGKLSENGELENNDDAADDDARRAWEVLECARTIFAQAGDHYLSRISICYELLGDLSLYVNDAFEQAAQDYAEAISSAERTEGAHSRRLSSLEHRRYVALRSAGHWHEAFDALSRAKAILAARIAELPNAEQSDEAALVQELESECRMVADAVRKLEKRTQTDLGKPGSSAKEGTGSSFKTAPSEIATAPPADAVTVIPRRGTKRCMAEDETQTENTPTETNLDTKDTQHAPSTASKAPNEQQSSVEYTALK
jgi:hypothetical protein